jgi:hypothetical protein
LETVPAGYESITLGGGKKLAFSRDKDTLPIADTELSENGVCIDKEMHSITPGRLLYKLIHDEDYGTCHDVNG